MGWSGWFRLGRSRLVSSMLVFGCGDRRMVGVEASNIHLITEIQMVALPYIQQYKIMITDYVVIN